jgi:Phytanoyl-CoA dioxygenase (PhyH)
LKVTDAQSTLVAREPHPGENVPMTGISSIKNAASQLLNECRYAARHVLSLRSVVSAGEPPQPIVAALRELRRVGFAVLPGFLSQERCADLIGRIDAGLAKYASFVQRDGSGADHRLFGLDAVDEEIRRVAFDPFAMDVLGRYEQASGYEGFALSARLVATAGNKGSGQGWHRDSAAHKQTKCIVYLTDVGPDNGPFQYVAGSHRPLDVVRCTHKYGYGVNQYRFSDDELRRLLAHEPDRLRTLTAPAGTAILFDSRALHRGMPIAAGRRYAITTYLWFNQPAPSHIRELTIESQLRNGAGRRDSR